MLSKIRPHIIQIIFIPGILFLIGNLHALAWGQDSDPKLVSPAKYTIPASAVDAEIDGTVVLAIQIDETGKPSRAVLMAGPMWPCGTEPVKALEELSSTLSETMMSLRFSPATRNGKPIEKSIALTLQLKNPKAGSELPQIDPAKGKPKITQISGGVLNGKAKSLPKPFYPPEARANRDSGAVSIQVLIDENGKVIRAGAVGGAPTLQFAARQSACDAKFTRTLLMGNPVKVSGVITYNFVP